MGACALTLSLGCCAGGSGTDSNHAKARGDVVEYAFGGIDGEEINSWKNQGRVTVLLFVTTFDIASQAQARRLEDLVRTHVPRLNAVAVVLEAPRYVSLARTFRDVLDLHYPVVMVDQHAIAEHPILANVKAVPTWIILDSMGRLSAARSGAFTPQELEQVAKNAE
jgi:hypothetical protein